MKNILIIILIVFSIQKSHAQLEVSISPFVALFGAVPPIAASMPINENISIGLDFLLIPEIAGFIFGKGRYYLNPKYGADRFHVGIFTGLADENFGFGFLTGYKIMSANGVFFDMALGVGRGFGDGDLNILPYGQFHIGYRFGKKIINDEMK